MFVYMLTPYLVEWAGGVIRSAVELSRRRFRLHFV